MRLPTIEEQEALTRQWDAADKHACWADGYEKNALALEKRSRSLQGAAGRAVSLPARTRLAFLAQEAEAAAERFRERAAQHRELSAELSGSACIDVRRREALLHGDSE